MTQVENYKSVLHKIFDQDIEFSNANIKNNCIGALLNQNCYNVFSKNFINRLQKLKKWFECSDETTKELIDKAKSIANEEGYKWSGAYSEFVALDYWLQFEDLQRTIKYPDKGKVDDFGDSIAKRIGRKEIDLDISFDIATTRIYTDVKSFLPLHTQLIDGIFEKLKLKINTQNYLIGITDLGEVDYLRTKNDYTYELTPNTNGTLINELAECINKKKTSLSYKLKSGTDAHFKIEYCGIGNTILFTTSIMQPYALAVDYKCKILDYYNKLLVEQPSIITFVINPWLYKDVYLVGKEFYQTFFRAFARRVFFELSKDDTDMEKLFPEKLTGKNIKISDVANYVTGIVFIVDNSVTETDSNKLYDTYMYLNPNAKNKKLTIGSWDILNWTPKIDKPYIDDFYYDNY